MQGFLIQEESSHGKEVLHSVSQSVSNLERTISQIVLTEQSLKPTMDVQQYTFEEESSLYDSK